MRTMVIALAAAAAMTMAAPAGAAAQGPPGQAQAKKGPPPEAKAKAQGQGQGQDNPQARGQGSAKARGQGKGQGQGQAQSRGQGASQGSAARAANARARRGGPAPDRATFNRNLVEKAVQARGRKATGGRNVEVRRGDGTIQVVRDDGVSLFELDARSAADLGYWRAVVAPRARDRSDGEGGGIFGRGDRYPSDRNDRGGAPAFCRSGEGHPVWGRDWCLDKGFGLGDGRSAWGVDRDISDIVLRPDPQRDVLDRGGLIDVLGDVVFGRLALQSLVLGADEPLQGRWLSSREGPRVLRVRAGDLPVAELVDYERDGRVDRILFNLGG